jgi:hypothetical protein
VKKEWAETVEEGDDSKNVMVVSQWDSQHLNIASLLGPGRA